jgi:hypothetical protein
LSQRRSEGAGSGLGSTNAFAWFFDAFAFAKSRLTWFDGHFEKEKQK